MVSGGIQISASNVEDAIEEGLARLGLSRDRVEIEIVNQGSRGLLGLGARDALVRVTPIQPDDPIEIEAAPVDLAPERVGPAQSEPKVAEQAAPKPSMAETPSDYSLSHDQVTEVARQTLSELISKMGIDCQVTVSHEVAEDGEQAPITLNVAGEEANELIGRQGEVLDSLQYMTRLIVSREVEQWVRLVVDVEQYKKRRAQSLRQLADRVASRVARTQQPVALEPMPPNERRAIHIALRDHPSVTTQSVGKGDHRKVTIIPKR